MLPQNMGQMDRYIRIGVAVVAVLLGVLAGNTVLLIVGVVVAGIMLFTATTRACPLYMPFKIDTRTSEEKGS